MKIKKYLSLLFLSVILINCSSTFEEPDVDTDLDGVIDVLDNCISESNVNQIDSDGDGIGDACDKTISFDAVPCVGGVAGTYPCSGYDLILHIPMTTFGANSVNDSWGWTDATTGKEYAILGLDIGTAFIDISTPSEAIYVGILPTATFNSSWRDVKVYKDHAYIVSEAQDHGMQVFDLTRLRDVPRTPLTFDADAHFTGFGNAHNIVINEETGYAYPVGTSRNGPFKGGPLFINIQDPKNPIDEGGFGMDNYSHDAQVVTYSGPDADHTGKEILIGSNENEISIVDVSDKANPISLSTISYSDVGYTHQGWFTKDMNYFILGDELDERQKGFNTRTLVFDFTDLDNPAFLTTYTGPTSAIDHNGYVKDDLFYLANYTAGVRMIDIENIGGSILTEVGFFDTYTANDGANFDGVWNVFPYFESGNILLSDIGTGLYLIKKN